MRMINKERRSAEWVPIWDSRKKTHWIVNESKRIKTNHNEACSRTHFESAKRNKNVFTIESPDSAVAATAIAMKLCMPNIQQRFLFCTIFDARNARQIIISIEAVVRIELMSLNKQSSILKCVVIVVQCVFIRLFDVFHRTRIINRSFWSLAGFDIVSFSLALCTRHVSQWNDELKRKKKNGVRNFAQNELIVWLRRHTRCEWFPMCGCHYCSDTF